MSDASGYGAFAIHYDALTANVDYKRRAAYFDSLVARHASALRGGLLLDLACGTGSLALALAALGYDVIGADASADMLSVAMGKAAEAGRDILFLRQAMTALDLYGTVDITVCALDSLNHLPDEAAFSAALSRVSLFTNPGGLFLFDVNTAYKHREILADNAFVYEPDGLFCVWRNAWSKPHDRVDIALDFFVERPGGRYERTSERFSERVFARGTIESLLVENGFRLLAVYGDDSDEPPHEKTQREVYAAQKME